MSRATITPEQKERLKTALSSGSRLGAADMRLINIESYKIRLGAEWFKYKTIIESYATAAIKAELDVGDFFVETKSGYGIFFFKKDLEQIQVISDRIAQRLQRELSREATFRDPPLVCKAISVNCDEMLRQLESGDSKASGPGPALRNAGALAGALAGTAPGISFAPLWHVKFEQILGSISLPSAREARFRITDRGYYTVNADIAKSDVRDFEAVLSAAYKLYKAGRPSMIIFSLNFTNFCAAQFNKEYMQAVRQTPASLLPYLTPRFVRIPPGTPQTLLATKVQLLASITKRVALQTPAIIAQSTFQFVPCAMLATSWGEIGRMVSGDASGLKAAEPLVRSFCQLAKKIRQNALIEGLDTLEALDLAIAAGADFVSGPVIAAATASPCEQRWLTLDEIRASAPAAAAHGSLWDHEVHLV